MAVQTNNFEMWQDEKTPIVVASVDTEFNVWFNEVPIEDRDIGSTPLPRRRVFDF